MTRNKLYIIFAVVAVIIVAAIIYRNRTDGGVQKTHPVVVVNSTSTAPATECGSGESCRDDAIRTCANADGIMTIRSHGYDTDGEIDKNKVTTSTLAYVFERIDEEDGCHFTLQERRASGGDVHFYCTSETVPETQQFFDDWRSGVFLDGIMAFCNPTELQASANKDFPWECNYRTGIHCDADRAL